MKGGVTGEVYKTNGVVPHCMQTVCELVPKDCCNEIAFVLHLLLDYVLSFTHPRRSQTGLTELFTHVPIAYVVITIESYRGAALSLRRHPPSEAVCELRIGIATRSTIELHSDWRIEGVTTSA